MESEQTLDEDESEGVHTHQDERENWSREDEDDRVGQHHLRDRVEGQCDADRADKAPEEEHTAQLGGDVEVDLLHVHDNLDTKEGQRHQYTVLYRRALRYALSILQAPCTAEIALRLKNVPS